MLTELKDVKHALSAMELSSIISITNENGMITYVNDCFCEISKFDRNEIIGQSHHTVNSGYHPAAYFQDLWETISQKLVWKGEMKNRAKDGTDYWISMTVMPIVNDQGFVYQYVSIGTDITSRKQNENKLLQTMENLHDIENALDASSIVAITDDKGVITYINEKFCEISMYDRAELIGKTHRVINSGYHPKSFFKEMWETIKQGQVWKGEVKNRAKDGSEYWMHTTIVPFLNDDRRPRQFISIRTDITDRVKAETALAERTKQLAKAHDEAIKANMIKSQFLANMSHELRTPLNAIIGYSEMLQEEAEELEESFFAEDLAKINKAGNHLLALINDILDISKVEAGKMELHLETYSLPDLIQDVMTTIRPLVESKGNKLLTDCRDVGDFTSDVTKLRQILINLLSNANKFTEAGSIAFDIYKEARGNRFGFAFRIRDTGIGMTPDQLEKLFQPFTQADASTTRKYGGTGLGLAISQRFSQIMGGDISVESEFGIGTTFTCWLPSTLPETGAVEVYDEEIEAIQALALKSDSELAAIPDVICSLGEGSKSSRTLGAAEFQIEPIQRESLIAVMNQFAVNRAEHTVLVIEDDQAANEQAARLLRMEGYNVCEARNGVIALACMGRVKPSLIVLDLLMPGMDGLAFIEEWRKHDKWSPIPVILLTEKYMAPDDRQSKKHKPAKGGPLYVQDITSRG
ncbi:PAS domain-containing protein [Paenibacillus sp. 2TAB23]|uniref:PAS domain-containing hybrid sensor histidine kinase/response regulator n=1 Tax=Paenibacillus sp. 2TAB23 TaxID=3233004 RepID=UPI003F9584DF